MNIVNDLIGPLVVALAVAASAYYALRHLAPRSSNRLQASLARGLRALPSPWLRRLGIRLIPHTVSGGDCSSACGSCGGCAPKTRATPDSEHTLEFHRRR